MPLDRNTELEEPTRISTSKDRQKIIESLKTGKWFNITEITKITGLDEKKIKTRLTVMKRDKLVIVGQHKGIRYYQLTEKGLDRC